MKRKLHWDEIKDRTKNAVFVATLAMFASLPMFHYRFLHLGEHLFGRQPSSQQAYYLALSQSFLVMAAAFLSALVCFLYQDRLDLPPFGRLMDGAAGLLSGLAIGAMLTPVVYFACDSEILRRIPLLFPKSGLYALAHMAGAAITQETIFRMGLMSIGLYFLKRRRWTGYPWPVVAPVAAFGAAGNYLLLVKFNLVQFLPPTQTVFALALSLLLQALYCHVYLQHGFLSAAAFHMGADVKLAIYALMR